jgi:hypothetical protein
LLLKTLANKTTFHVMLLVIQIMRDTNERGTELDNVTKLERKGFAIVPRDFFSKFSSPIFAFNHFSTVGTLFKKN